MKLKSIYGLALAALAAGAAVTACTDANDWETNPAYDRMFGVNSNKISIETDQEDPSSITVTFTPIQGAEYYVMEVSTDSLYDDVPMGGDNATVFGEDKTITTSPAKLTNLREETNYFMRIKTMSSTSAESHWVYYNMGESFKTLGIIYDVPSSDILESSVTLRWIAGAEVTHIAYTTTVGEQEVTETRTLTDAEIAASSCTITGLEQNKTYKFAIYNNDVLRGTKTVKTAKAMPWATVRQELGDDVTQIDQELMDMLAQKAKLSVLGGNYQQVRSFDVLEGAAHNNAAAGAFMGVGMGMGAGFNMFGGAPGAAGAPAVLNTQGAPAEKKLSMAEKISMLKELGELRTSGILTEEEFQEQKRRILS